RDRQAAADDSSAAARSRARAPPAGPASGKSPARSATTPAPRRTKKISSCELQQRRVAVGQRPHQFVLEIGGALTNVLRHPLVVERARPRDLAPQARAEIAVAAPGDDLRF